MDWFKKHTDTVIILGGILASVFWMNAQFTHIEKHFSSIEKEIAIMKTVMVMKNIMPPELAKGDAEK